MDEFELGKMFSNHHQASGPNWSSSAAALPSMDKLSSKGFSAGLYHSLKSSQSSAIKVWSDRVMEKHKTVDLQTPEAGI